jgi:lipooligosaccharide transport system permease protein
MLNRIVGLAKITMLLPPLGSGSKAVLLRNFKVFAQSAWLQTLISLLEPLFIWVAFGYFLGHWVPDIGGVDYFTYLLPAIIALSGMQGSFYESTLGPQTKQNREHVYRMWSYTALSESEIVGGEILWAALRGWASSALMIVVAWLADFISFRSVVEMSLIMALACYSFSAFGFWLATRKEKNEGQIGLVQVAFILPMFLFSNTFFPLDLVLPNLHGIVDAFPMANVMTLLRSSQHQQIDPLFLFAVGYLVLWCILFTNLANHHWTSRYRK